jgi:hypothetical protein
MQVSHTFSNVGGAFDSVLPAAYSLTFLRLLSLSLR